MEKISIDKLHDEIIPNLGPDELILDVRTPAEFAADERVKQEWLEV